MASQASEVQVQKLYIAYFGRPADRAGLDFYADALDAGTTSVDAIATSFGNSAEAAPIVALSAQDFVEALYMQAFGRAYDVSTDGTFWVDAINSGATTKELAFIQILDGATGADVTAVNNKVEVAQTFTDAVEVGAYAGAAAAAAAKAVLDGVTADPVTVTTGNDAAADAAADLNANVVVPGVPGDTFMLTADADVLTGTANDDTFTAPLTVAGTQTLQTFDRIDGGEGTDTLKATVDTNVVLANTVENVENLFFRDISTGGTTINLANVAGVEQVWSNNSLSSLTVNNVDNVVTAGVVGGEETVGVPNSTFTVNYANAAVVTDAEDADGRFTQAVALDNASVILDITAAGAALAPTNTTLELDLTGDSNVDLGTLLLQATGLDTITTSGEGSIDLDLADTANAGANALTGDLTVTLGAGDDTLRLDGTDLDGNDEIDLGEGENTLVMSGIATDVELAALDLSGVTNAGALGFADALHLGADATLDLEDRGEVTFEGAVSGGNVLTVETSSADLTANFEAASTTGLEVSDEVANLTLNTGTTGNGNGADLTIGSLTNAADTNGNTESLKTLTLVDVNADADTALSHSITLGDGVTELDGLTTIDLSEAGQRSADGATVDDVTLDASNAGFNGPVTIKVGEAELVYTSDLAGLREVFQFVGDEISDASVSAFTVTAAGNGDKLDFSQFAGVSSLNDLSITADATSYFIAAADGQFEGVIELTGLAFAGIEQSILEANGFIF